MTDRFSKPENSGRKPSYQKRHPSLEPDVVNDRHMETKTRTALESGAFTTSIQAEETMKFPDPKLLTAFVTVPCYQVRRCEPINPWCPLFIPHELVRKP